MNLRAKILLLLVGTIAALLAVVHTVSTQITLEGARLSDEEVALRARDGVKDIINYAAEELSTKVKDWAHWDDTYTFVDHRSNEYISSNFSLESLKNFSLDGVLILNKRGEVVYSGLIDTSGEKITPFPGKLLEDVRATPALLAPLKTDIVTQGLLLLDSRPAFVSAGSVLTSERKGAVKGVMILIEFVDDALLNRLKRLARTPFQFEARNNRTSNREEIKGPRIASLPGDLLRVSDYIPNLTGDAGIGFYFTIDRSVYRQAVSGLYTSQYLILLSGAAFCLVILLFLERIVLARLGEFHRGLKRIKEERNPAVRFHVDGKDEISSLCGLTNEVLSSLETVEREHIESEGRFRHLADAAPVMIWMSEPDRLRNYFNKGWLDFVGRKLEAELGNGWTEGVHPRDLVGYVVTYTRAFDAFEPFQIEYRLLRYDGMYRWLIDFGVPRYDVAGTFLGYIGSCYDVTDRRLAEAEMKNSRDIAERASQSKSQFLANMSHEIRTPLNAILGLTDLVLDSPLDDEQRENLDTVRSSCDSLLAIINDVLDFSKIEAGKLTLSETNFALKDILSSIVKLLTVPAEQKGIRIRVEVRPNVPGSFYGDCDRLGQILINLLSNAIKFSHENSEVLLLVFLSKLPGDEGKVNFSVVDHGIGIPSDRQAEIFHPFTQADGSITREYGGTGLGLTISNRIVTLMDGKLWVESEVGKGATFHFNVALKRVSSSVSAVTKRSSLDSAVVRAANLKAKLLVVEDNVINQKLIVKLLEIKGYSVKLASNGEEALSFSTAEAFSLILMDCQMPVMDGYTATREIREMEKVSGKHVPIVAMTAHALDGDREKCLQAGMDNYLTKPIDRHRLYELVEKYVMDSAARR